MDASFVSIDVKLEMNFIEMRHSFLPPPLDTRPSTCAEEVLTSQARCCGDAHALGILPHLKCA